MWPLTIGLTGTIGAGKSTVAALLSEHGAEIVSGDTLGKIAVEESDNILHDIRERFGATVFSEDGSLNRREFGHVVFVSAEHSEWLTERTFPTIFQLWCDRVKHCKSPVIVLDAALIFEWKIEIEFDLIIVVLATPDRVKQRLAASDRLSAAEIEGRLLRQLPATYKSARADIVIENDQPQYELRPRIQHIWNQSIQPKIERKHISAP